MRLPLLVLTIGPIAMGAGASVSPAEWSRIADLHTGRSAHAVVASDRGIYVLAGTGSDGKPVTSVERFDGNAWSEETTLPGEGLNAPAAAMIGNHIYLIGGFGTTTNRPTAAVRRYDTITKKWNDASPLPAPRGGHGAVVMNGRIHVIGGGNSVSTIDDHSVFDPKTNAWSEAARLPRRTGSPATTVANGKLLSIGGRSGAEDFGDVHIYDAGVDRWSPGSVIPPRGTAGAATLGGAIYVIGGESQAERRVLGDVLRLDSAASRWMADSQMPVPRNYARVVVFKGAIYVIGGSTEFGASHSSRGSTLVERFKPASH